MPQRPSISLSPGREAALAGILIAAIYLAASLSTAMLVGAWNDDGVYTVLGKSLAEGHGYRSLHLVGDPVQVKYPPGFPVLLALFWKLTGSLDGVQRAVSLLHPIVIGAVAGLLWRLGRERFQVPRILLAAFVIAPLLFDASIQYFTIPLSEPWFMLGWAAVLVTWYLPSRPAATERPLGARQRDPGARKSFRAEPWIPALLASFTTLFRTQGIVLVVGVLAAVWLRKRRRGHGIVVTLVALGPLVVWKILHAMMIRRGPLADLPDEGGYLGWFAGNGVLGSLKAVATGVASNAAKYLEQLGPYLLGNASAGRLLAALLLLMLLGGTLAALRRYPFLAGSVVGGIAVVLVWPFAQDRLLLSTLPFLGLAACVTFERLSAVRNRWFVPGLALATGLLLIRQVTVHREALDAFSNRKPARFYSPTHLLPLTSRYLASASRWVIANTGEQDHLLIDYPAAIYLYTGRKTVPANPAESAVLRSAFEVPGRYLARHILEDSISVVVVGIPGSPIIRDLETVRKQCPAVLTWVGSESGNFPLRFRVSRDEACLSQLVDGR
ncbi:MAG TPA: hypothetical protein VFU03_07770 [Gemmatimonadales bacterium]|nr:hypothetical protein [Gemmatimonadales bacterium]